VVVNGELRHACAVAKRSSSWHSLGLVTQYPLGTNAQELARLAFQHEVWGASTRAFLDRLSLPRGARCLDLGAGPGFVTLELAERVGPKGRVVALDESPLWMEHLRGEIARQGVTNVELVCTRLQDAVLAPASFDLIFARWVWSFIPEPAPLMRSFARALKPGGSFVMQDYNHEGVSIFPESPGLRAVVRATRALYAAAGGDAWVAGRAPRLFAEAGLETASITPTVLCGGPQSGVFRWAGLFFPHFSEKMVAQGWLSPEERAQFLSEWSARESDPTSLFFSPIVVDAWARRPLV
jgi:SAM-dependent methyltransferase